MKPREASLVQGSTALRSLPSIDRLLRDPRAEPLVTAYGTTLLTTQARGLIDDLRERIRHEGVDAHALDVDVLLTTLEQRCRDRLSPKMRTVYNLTGTVIHTNLGRALLADEALQQVLRMMAAPNNLEYDLATGRRGDRDDLVESLLCELTGAQAATVVNNNAAAVLLTIAAVARGREVIVSRGELVEIGGAFRMPDVMAAAGAQLVEVGTTNRTHPADYEAAITPNTALLMKVHTSNYAIQGYTSQVDERDLAQIAHARGLPLATDLGSGSLIDLAAYGLPAEPLPRDKIDAGCDIVTFSGDKLLGGPQAGLIVGRRDLVDRIRRFPMKRALRMSKLPLAALEATLRLYLSPELLPTRLPTLRLLTRPADSIRAVAQRLAPVVQQALGREWNVEVVTLSSQIGSGSLPIDRLPSAGIGITPAQRAGAGRRLDELSAAFRALPRPVLGRISEDRYLWDLRCLEDIPDQLNPFLAQLPAVGLAVR